MSIGRLKSPNLDDRSWQDIVDEARALIPKYAPEWTDHNPSDLGITLIELFAWIVEGLIYRLNRVPEKNFIEFLNLVGITRDPATPARADLTFKVTGIGPVPIPAGTQAATPQTETEEAVIFETDKDLNALPVNLTHCLITKEDVSPHTYENLSRSLVTGPILAKEVEVSSVFQKGILLGVDSSIAGPIHINFRFKKTAPKNSIQLKAAYSSSDWKEIAISDDQTEAFTKNGKLVIQFPTDWQASKPSDWTDTPVKPASNADRVEDSRFWIEIEVGNLMTSGAITFMLESIAINSVSATNALTVNKSENDAQAELLGVSDGKSFQFFSLKNSPLFKKRGVADPYEHLKIQVRESLGGGVFGPWEDWAKVVDIPKEAGKYFKLDPVTSEIMLGNFDTVEGKGHGTIPPQGSEIRALTYRHIVGGVKGNVSANTINVLRNVSSGVIEVNNPAAAVGGADQEAVEDTKRRGPEALKNRFRAVTVEDYEFLAKEASSAVRKVRALPPRLHDKKDLPNNIEVSDPWMYAGLNRSPGRINVIIVPSESIFVARPKPDESLILEVSDYLNNRRVATAMLHVSGPKYLPINVEVDFSVFQRAIDEGVADKGDVQEKIKEDINKFLHPLFGNIDGNGWEVGQHVFIADLFEYIMPDPDIAFIQRLQIEAAVPDYHDATLPSFDPVERPFDIDILGVWVQLADYELVCSGSHKVKPLDGNQ